MAGKFKINYHWAAKIKPPWCYSDINMTVFFNHNTIDNTGNVPVNAKYFR